MKRIIIECRDEDFEKVNLFLVKSQLKTKKLKDINIIYHTPTKDLKGWNRLFWWLHK